MGLGAGANVFMGLGTGASRKVNKNAAVCCERSSALTFWSKSVSALAIGGLVLGLAACADTSSETQHSSAAESQDLETPPSVSVHDGAIDVDPTVPVEVTGENKLQAVTMLNEVGYEVESVLSDDGKTWKTDEVLGYNRSYTIEATDVEGNTTTVSFTTPQPASQSSVAMVPLPDSTVGVGQTINFRFAGTVYDRQAVQDAITIETSNDTVGAFYWISNSELRWRPQEYWEPGTTVTVQADIYGVDMGKGMWGSKDNSTSFTIGDDVRAVVDNASKTMTVTRNGQTLRSVPVSLGRSEYPTPNGTYLVGDQHNELVMDSTTFGLTGEGSYRTEVNFATQMSYSGIYVHGAPWSEWAQGKTNTSHGCINVTDSDAQWFMNTVKRGDVIEVKNTSGGTLSGYDGLGDWNIDWETWSAGNADEIGSW